MTNVQIEKLTRIFNGEKVVATDEDMLTFENLPANGSLRYLVTDHNPDQVGTKDLWLAYILPNKLTEAKLLASGICGDSCPHPNKGAL